MVLLVSCVDPYDPEISSEIDLVVVDGTITNQAEPQVVRLNRAKTISGRFGNSPILNAQVQVVVNSSQVIQLRESAPGTYQLPEGFRGEAGSSYQLRFQLSDGKRYESSPEVLIASPPIAKVSAHFNPQSFQEGEVSQIRAGHDFYLDTKDPAGQRNYYKWDWVLYEKQKYCHTCYESIYAVNNVIIDIYTPLYQMFFFQSGNQPFEDCFSPPEGSLAKEALRKVKFDYICRTQCWEILYNHDLNLFDDGLTNGGAILERKVARIPFYQHGPCLVEIRQLALTSDAHRFYKLMESQTQKTGGLGDTPPVAPIGNVKNTGNPREIVVGFFTAAGVSSVRYWLQRDDASGSAPGLFEALNGRVPIEEPAPPFGPAMIQNGPARPPTAVCVPSTSRTPIKPEGWQQ